MRYTTRTKVVVSAFAMMLVLTSCSTGGAGNEQPTSTSGGQSSGAGVSEAVKASVAKYKDLPTFTSPGDPIDPTSLKGKSMYFIPLAPNPFNLSIQESMKSIADEIGIKFTVYNNQGQSSQWVQGMNTAVSAKADIIVLSTAPDPRILQPQIAAAKKAGIPVLVTHFYDNSSPLPPDCDGCANVTGILAAPFSEAGKAAADWVIEDSGGKANVLVLGSTEIASSPGTVSTIQKELADACDDCKSTVINIPVADWNTKVQSEVQAAVNKDPSINYVYPLYDAMVAGAVPALTTIGMTDKVKVVSFNGSPFALKFIQDKNVAAMNVGEDTIGIGYASMDQAFRILLDKPLVEAHTPIRIWDATNVDETGTPPEVGKGYGAAMSEGYLKLWGMG